jgi:hypothetical protein
MVSFHGHFLRILLILTLSATVALADGPIVFQSLSPIKAYPGNPGAEMFSARYSDGMDIKIAIYWPSVANGALPPIGVINGFGLDLSYLHPFAQEMSQKGYPVFVIQTPGNGVGAVRSARPAGADGFQHSIEGFGSMYMDGLGEALRKHFGRKIVILGHSRAGYQIRFFLTGLRYQGTHANGKPLLKYDPKALASARENFLAVASLYSPLKVDPRLRNMAERFPRAVQQLKTIENSSERLNQYIIGMASDAGAAIAHTIAATLDPFGLRFWMPGIREDFARRVEQARCQAEAQARRDIEAKKEEALASIRDVMTGKKQISSRELSQLRQLTGFMRGLGIDVDDLTEADLDAMYWMNGPGVPDKAMDHLLKFGSKEGPTPVQYDELMSMAKSDGLQSWKTYGVDETGKNIPVFKQLLRAARDIRDQGPFPYLIFEATEDGSTDSGEREAKLLNANLIIIRGHHGGAVLTPKTIAEFEQKLRTSCEELLAPVSSRK